nr:ribonuclease H-like domain-containing protein [Tanacetum cinerariifolium]
MKFVYIALMEMESQSLVAGNEDLSTIPEKESDKFKKSSIEDLVPILSESEDTSENIESKDSYDSNLDEPDFLVTPLFDANKDECFNSRGDDDEINVLDYEEKNDDLFDLEPKNYDWKKILYNAPILMTDDKVFDPGIHDQIFSPTYVSLPFEDRHYLFFTYVVWIFLPNFTYLVVSPFLLSSRISVSLIVSLDLSKLAETSNPSQPIPLPTSQIPHTLSSIKLPILKKGEYDIWGMKMEHYLCHTDYPIWQVIQNGNGPVSVTTDTHGMIKVLPPKTAKEVVARERERKARTTLLMALPEDHLVKFHFMADAKDIWEAIKSIFYGNDESKKMQKYLLKQQFKGFSVSSSEGLHKRYDRFQTLMGQLEINGAGVSNEDTNQKFLLGSSFPSQQRSYGIQEEDI